MLSANSGGSFRVCRRAQARPTSEWQEKRQFSAPKAGVRRAESCRRKHFSAFGQAPGARGVSAPSPAVLRNWGVWTHALVGLPGPWGQPEPPSPAPALTGVHPWTVPRSSMRPTLLHARQGGLWRLAARPDPGLEAQCESPPQMWAGPCPASPASAGRCRSSSPKAVLDWGFVALTPVPRA